MSMTNCSYCTPGLCCDCMHDTRGFCGDYRENEFCAMQESDGSCFKCPKCGRVFIEKPEGTEKAMERLTKWDDTNKRWIENHDNDTRKWKNGSRSCMEKLAAYENSGLAPDEVAELARATAEGRLVVLPISIGTEIFYIANSHRAASNNKNHLARVIKSRKIDSITTGKDGYMSMSYGTTLNTSVNEIGKTIFLTREEAEAALKGEKDKC